MSINADKLLEWIESDEANNYHLTQYIYKQKLKDFIISQSQEQEVLSGRAIFKTDQPEKEHKAISGLEKSYAEEDVEKIIEYTKHFEYLDGTKRQADITAKEILNKWEEKYRNP